MQTALNNRQLKTSGLNDVDNGQLALFCQFLYHLPYYALLLDDHLKIVESNARYLEDTESINTTEFLGKGPGDILQCENARGVGCGNSLTCSYCDINNTIAECRQFNSAVSKVCKLISNKNNFIKAHEFMARCSPVLIADTRFFLLTLIDITADSRKRSLEKIFFHDVLNMINGISGLLQCMNEDMSKAEWNEYYYMLTNVTSRLMETIITQRDLVYAENKELRANLKWVSAKEVIDAVMANSLLKNNNKSQIILNVENYDFFIYTDTVLLMRVLVNMLKNALEAKNKNPLITLGFTNKQNHAAFFVHNYAYIPHNHAKHVFQPMWSTKGNNRGLGTYSIRLIGEYYLKGKVYFESYPDKGTTFTIELPVNINTL
jgi:signal transduction histidine kinase